MTAGPVTDRIYLRDAQCRAFDAIVVAVEDAGRVALDATAFYATGGGQPHDTGTLAWEGGSAAVVDVRGHGPVMWHTLEGDAPAVGARVRGTLDWERRYGLMRTHTALHILCGVIYNTWGAAVTGGNMEPLRARMDFEFGPLPEGFGAEVAELVNAEIAADRPVEVSFWPRAAALGDADLIRTKVNLISRVGDRDQGGGHRGFGPPGRRRHACGLPGEVGHFEVTKTESKGKANKRLRIALGDA